MYYVYIIKSSKSKRFYIGWTANLKNRLSDHNAGENKSTKAYVPWKLQFYAAFKTEKLAKNFEMYLKSGSGRAFSYKRLLP